MKGRYADKAAVGAKIGNWCNRSKAAIGRTEPHSLLADADQCDALL
jgi:hypothetical protein